jgi:hypothetical protein
VWKGKWIGRGGGLLVAIKKIHIWGITDRMRDEIFSEVCILGLIINLYLFILLIICVYFILFDY